MELEENLAYEKANMWIVRIPKSGENYYKFTPYQVEYDKNWHCFYVLKEAFDEYLEPYFDDYLCYNNVFYSGVMRIDKLHMTRLLAPIVNDKLPKLSEKCLNRIRPLDCCSKEEYDNEVLWEFYNTFISFLQRVYKDFADVCPEILIKEELGHKESIGYKGA